jgi:hypothetical protein
MGSLSFEPKIKTAASFPDASLALLVLTIDWGAR